MYDPTSDTPFTRGSGHAPFNIRVMDVDAFVRDHHALPVTTGMIQEPSSNRFHPDGLYSEEIFGPLGSEERMTQFGYINLHTEIITPPVYVNLIKLGSHFEDIMAGRAYGVWDPVAKTITRVIGDPESVPGADTGFTFFLSHFPEMEFERTKSLVRDTKVDLLDKYRTISLITKCLVEPAGMRDISQDANGRMIQDDQNKLYATLIAYAQGIPPGAKSSLYDPLRYQIQCKVVEIYNYFNNFLSGKRGFIQGSYASRRIACGTRNVIAAATLTASTPDDPQMLKVDETRVGLFQTLKAFQPLMSYGFRTLFTSHIFGEDGTALNVPLTNPKTLALEYVAISDEERKKFTTSDGVGAWINRFRNTDVRFKPITVKGEDGKYYYLCMVYDTGDSICFFRTLTDLKEFLPGPVDKTKIRPLTWAEAFYTAAYIETKPCHVFVTRYPVIEDTSCYPSKIHVSSTSTARIVSVRDLINGSDDVVVLPEYPVLGSAFIDTVSCSPSKLAGLGAD